MVRTDPSLASTVVDALPGVMQAAYGDRGWILETRAPNRLLAELVRRIDEAGALLLEVELRGPSLEDVFIELTGRPWSGGEPHGDVCVTALPDLNGWIRHLLLTIALNFANPQAIVYGYLVPVFFLVAFGSVFRADSPPLLAHMGQILTITILGGACFGLPTALVAEREQGVWRRYRLLPIPVAWLVFSAMIARVLIVASAVLIQIALARAVYGTPLPTQPGIGGAGISLCDRGLSGTRSVDRGAGRQRARGSGAWPVHLPPDDHDRRSRSAVGGPSGLGAACRRLYAGPLRG